MSKAHIFIGTGVKWRERKKDIVKKRKVTNAQIEKINGRWKADFERKRKRQNGNESQKGDVIQFTKLVKTQIE